MTSKYAAPFGAGLPPMPSREMIDRIANLTESAQRAADVKAARDALDALTDFQATAIMRDRADAMAPCDQLALGDLISRSAHMRDRVNTPNTFREIEIEIERNDE